jgi:peptidoglycan/xylan/chitin deacetylase (PgdA/CDA1 family)
MSTLFRGNTPLGGARYAVLDLVAGALWRIPGCFGITRLLGPSYSLRCVVFHDVSANESPFTNGMGVSIFPNQFEAALRFLVRYYNPIGLRDLLNNYGRGLPPRAVLVTFDDGYASVMKSAVPLCHELAVPAVFFLNAAFVNNHRLAPDNLVCYVANVLGMEVINSAVRSVKGDGAPTLHSLADVFTRLFPAITLSERQHFLDTLVHLGGISERQLAMQAGLYMTSKQLGELASLDFEIGSHTYTHVRCRSLSPQTFPQEIDRNKAELESLSGRKVRSFSLPYGSSADLTGDLARHLHLSGHEAVFLSESVANPRGADLFHLDRVSPRADGEDVFFFEMEVLPRFRAIRNRFLRRRHESPCAGQTAGVE